MYACLFISLVTILKIGIASASDYHIVLTDNSPVVRGATVRFTAKVYYYDGTPAEGSFKYEWEDNSIKEHEATHESKIPVDTWNVTYPHNGYFPPGEYEVQVSVSKCYLLICFLITSQRKMFELTENLNGKLQLAQKNRVIDGRFVSNVNSVTHKIVLNESDAEYLNKTATSVTTFWFIDCIYYGMTDDYTFTYKYSDVNKRHNVEALVVAGYEPITTPAPSTTTTTTTTTKPTTTTSTAAPKTTKPVTTALPPTTPNPTNGSAVETRHKRAAENGSHIMVRVNGTLVPYNVTFPYVCLSNNTIVPDVNKTYGYFSRRLIAKAPVSNISVTGNYWLHKGDVLNLLVRCHGTPQFYYCKHIYEGIYNVTGNETCDVPTPDISDSCEFPIKRFLHKAQKYTIAIVIYNDVGKVVSPVTVTIYEVTKQAQLSVIVVPVAFSLVAVVLIVFGVAYYVQNRSRFTVEVADFNFGQQCSDLEYKTFRERLRDSISNAFMRAPTPSSSDPSIWPPGRKYGSLT